MCGRFTLYASADDLAKHYDAAAPEGVRARYNIAPTQPVAAVRARREGGRTIANLHWGLLPRWAKDRKLAYRTINARAETIASKPSFRSAYRYRRCIVPASGYYEWVKADDGGKQPYLIRRADDAVLSMAGLWERWTPPGEDGVVESCTVVTTESVGQVRDVHHRMPVLLDRADFDRWLDPTCTDGDAVAPLLAPYRHEDLLIHPVSRHVNNARHEDPTCIERL